MSNINTKLKHEKNDLQRQVIKAWKLYPYLMKRLKRASSTSVRDDLKQKELDSCYSFPALSDQCLLYLENIAYMKARRMTINKYGFSNSAFYKSSLEIRTAQKAVRLLSDMTNYEVCPDPRKQIDKFPLIGPFVVDTLIIGIGPNSKPNGPNFDGTVIEVDGSVHERASKRLKDDLMDRTLRRLGIYPFRIPAFMLVVSRKTTESEAIRNSQYFEKVITEFKQHAINRRISVKKIEKLKNRIRLLTVVSRLSPREIDEALKERGINFNLEVEIKSKKNKRNGKMEVCKPGAINANTKDIGKAKTAQTHHFSRPRSHGNLKKTKARKQFKFYKISGSNGA